MLQRIPLTDAERLTVLEQRIKFLEVMMLSLCGSQDYLYAPAREMCEELEDCYPDRDRAASSIPDLRKDRACP